MLRHIIGVALDVYCVSNFLNYMVIDAVKNSCVHLKFWCFSTEVIFGGSIEYRH